MVPNNFNPILASVPILYPLKTLENQRFSDVFRGHEMQTLVKNGLRDQSNESIYYSMFSFSYIDNSPYNRFTASAAVSKI